MKPTATVMVTVTVKARQALDVQPWCTEIAGQQVTLLLSGESVAIDQQAQVDQANMLLDYLTAENNR